MVAYGPLTLSTVLEKRCRHISPTPNSCTTGCLSSTIRWLDINNGEAAQVRLPLANQSKNSMLVHSVLLSYPNFRRHPCSASKSVPPVPETPKFSSANDATASYVIPTGIKICVSSYNFNVAQEGIVLLIWFPSKTDVTVSLIMPVRSSANSSGC